MLVLKRRPGEGIWIGNDVYVEVIDIVGRKVRLGFHAPAEVSVDRDEVRARKEAEGPDGGRP